MLEHDWFAPENNAYFQPSQLDKELLAQKHGDLPVFYAAVRELAKVDKSERDARVAGLGR